MSELLTAQTRSEDRVQDKSQAQKHRFRTDEPKRSAKPRLFLLVADLGVAEAFFLLAIALASRFGFGIRIAREGIDSLPILLAVLFPLIVAVSGLYRVDRLTSWRTQAGVGLRVLAWSIGISVGALFFFAHEIPWALRFVFVLYQALLGVWLLAVRPPVAVLLYRRYLGPPRAPERVLLIGADSVARDVARSLSQSLRGAEILGFTYPERPRSSQIRPFFHQDLDQIPQLVRELDADLVVVARPDLPRDRVVRLSDELVADGRRVNVVSNVFNKLVDSVPFETHNGVPLVAVGNTPLRGNAETQKRVFDLFATTLGSLLLLPALLTIAVLVKLSSPGPVFYTRERIGRNGRSFPFYKFRTMRAGADDTRHREYIRGLVKNGSAAAWDKTGKPIYKLIDDSRVTTIGRFLRRTSLDELPQLINVFRGEMSLIGPRPCLPFEHDLYEDWQKRRLQVTPGMTGLWQVTGRSYVTFEDMVLLDLFYIANWSFVMDLRILLRTVPVVIWGKGGV